MAETAEIYVRLQNQDYGPYTEANLRSHLKAGRIPFSAWVHRDGSWRLLAEEADLREDHPEFSAKPKNAPAKAKAQVAVPETRQATGAIDAPVGDSAAVLWFFVRDGKKLGPFSAAEIVSQLQRKQVDGGAFVWRPGFATWRKMSQVAEFSRDAMKRLVNEGAPVDVVLKRKFVRAPYEVEVIAHDNVRAVEGRSMVIGEGGLFLATTHPTHRVGARLKLHFREGDTSAFNAVAEVVSVVRGETPGYCLRFVALSDTDRRRIGKLVTDRK